MSLVFLDTSVLALRYLPLSMSPEVDAMLSDEANQFAVDALTPLEIESVLSRRSREAGGAQFQREAMRMQFDSDFHSGFFQVCPLDAHVLGHARRLIGNEGSPVATLDAIHLACALTLGATAMATHDRQLGRAARAAGLDVVSFI